MNDHLRWALYPVLLLFFLFMICSSCTNRNLTLVPGTAHLLNGTTEAPAGSSQSVAAVRGFTDTKRSLSDGQWRITPEKMILTINGISFSNSQDEIDDNEIEVNDCSVTYDQTKESLANLSDYSFSAPEGTYSMLTIFYSNTYQVLFNDPAGIYSNPTSATGLVTAAPGEGAKFIDVVDQNSSSDENQLTVYLSNAITIDADNPPQIYVVFNPIHWMVTNITGSSASSPAMSGNPPIIAATSNFSKSQYYTTVGTIGAYSEAGNVDCGFIFLYSDAETPYLVTEVDGNILSPVDNYCNPAVTFSGNKLEWGCFGMLGLDAEGYLSWAPGYYEITESGGTNVLGYRGIVEMKRMSTIGDTTTLSYQTTSSPPDPVDGSTNYTSGHPDITPDGSYIMTLLVN